MGKFQNKALGRIFGTSGKINHNRSGFIYGTVRLPGVAYHFNQKTSKPSWMWDGSYKQRVTNMVIWEFSCVQRDNQLVRSSLSARPLPEEVQPSTLRHTLHTVGSVAEAHCDEHCSVQQHFHNHVRTSLHYMWVPQMVSSKKNCAFVFLTADMAQSVQRLATGWTVRGSNPGRGAIFRLV
jgi:hypothetical protein